MGYVAHLAPEVVTGRNWFSARGRPLTPGRGAAFRGGQVQPPRDPDFALAFFGGLRGGGVDYREGGGVPPRSISYPLMCMTVPEATNSRAKYIRRRLRLKSNATTLARVPGPDYLLLPVRFAQASMSCLNHNLGCRGPRSITGRGMSE